MIKPAISTEEYMKLNNDQRREAFNQLAKRILIVHPEFLQESKKVDTIDLIEEIQEETKSLRVVKSKRRFF